MENTLSTKVKYIVPYVKCNLASFKTGLIKIQQLLTEILPIVLKKNWKKTKVLDKN